MKLHWMQVYEDSTLSGIKKISDIVDECNYYSMLLVYHSTASDFWIKCANALKKEHKFKYLLAIRTYAISPEYFVMMYRAFNEIQKNRIMFNIVAGDIHSDETCVDDLLINKKDFDTVEKRVNYTREWTKKVLLLLKKYNQNIPEIVMSGASLETLESAALLGDYNLVMMNDYIKSPERFSKCKNRMVSAALIVRETYEEALDVASNIHEPHQIDWTIFGTEEQIIEKIKELKKLGATDLMIRIHGNDDEYYRIHDFVKKHKGVIV